MNCKSKCNSRPLIHKGSTNITSWRVGSIQCKWGKHTFIQKMAKWIIELAHAQPAKSSYFLYSMQTAQKNIEWPLLGYCLYQLHFSMSMFCRCPKSFLPLMVQFFCTYLPTIYNSALHMTYSSSLDINSAALNQWTGRTGSQVQIEQMKLNELK